MKKTTKLAGLAAGLLTLAGVTFTSCDPDVLDSYGKDDLRGTWKTMEYDDNGVILPYYISKKADKDDGTAGNYYSISWWFDGNAENLGAKKGLFSQRLLNYGKENEVSFEIKDVYKLDKEGKETDKKLSSYKQFTTEPKNDTFWFGEYDVAANSGYSRGKMYLYYEAGINVRDLVKAGYKVSDEKTLVKGGDGNYTLAVGDAIVDVLKTWTLADFANFAFDNENGLENLKKEDLKSLKYNEVNAAGTKTTDTIWYNGAYKDNCVTLQVRYDEAGKKLLCSDVEYFRFNLRDKSWSGYSRMRSTLYDQKGQTDDHIIGGIYNQWVTEKDVAEGKIGNAIDAKSTKYGYKVLKGCSWSGTNTRYMGKISLTSTKDRIVWIPDTSDQKNAEYFKAADDGDTESKYDDVDSTTITEEKDPAQ